MVGKMEFYNHDRPAFKAGIAYANEWFDRNSA